MPDVTAVIEDTIAEWGKGTRPNSSLGDTAEQINHGNCDSFAEDVQDRLDGAEVLYDDSVGHVWVKYEGKHYDAKHPLGVLDPEELWADWH